MTTLGDAVVLAVNRFDVLAMNRAMGVDLNGSPSDAFLDDLQEVLSTLWLATIVPGYPVTS